MPFLRNVASGRPIPEDRLREVAHHYEIFDGKSPLNEFTYKQARKLEKLLSVWGVQSSGLRRDEKLASVH